MSISRVNNNIAAINANRNLDKTNLRIAKSIERLSSGLRINRAGDDAAGLTVASRLKAQTEGLNRAIANAQDGINVINVAEGALEETTNRLNRIRVLAIQAANTGVNDIAARKALQDEVFQATDEITRIAQTTQFNTNRLLNGDFKIASALKAGQVDVGVRVDASPVASTLESGNAFLNIQKVQDQNYKLATGDAKGGQQVFAMGMAERRDMAVSLGFFAATSSLGARFGTNTDALNVSFFNNVSIGANFVIAFDGVLADGVTVFNGSFTVSGAQNLSQLGSAINVAISAAESALFGDTIDTGFDLSAFFTGGRIALAIANGEQNFSKANINLRVINASGILLTEAKGVTRVSVDPGQVIGFDSSARAVQVGQIGNKITAITGSTFDSGEFTVTVQDVQGAQQRIVQSSVSFRDLTGAIISRTASLAADGVINGRFEAGVYTGYASLNTSSTIQLIGSNHDGTTFTRTFTIGSTAAQDANGIDGIVNSISGLIRELNSRRYSDGTQVVFNSAVATFAPDGTIKLIDEIGRNDSSMTFTLVFNVNNGGGNDALPGGGPLTISDKASLIQEGFAEQATVSIDGGPSQRVDAGEVVTLYGAESTIDGVPTPQVTLRLGRGLTAGTDTFIAQNAEYVGTLNGGPAVTFRAGDQDVQFIDGLSIGSGVAKVTTIDFDNILDVTKKSGGVDPGTTVIISTSNASMNFQIGAFSSQNFRLAIGDLRADALGFGRGSGRTISDIDITSITGANAALDIVDEALDQVNRTRSLLGAATNRLEATVANLSVSSENLSASESRLRDADIARESTEFTRNQVLLQAGISVLAQANFTSQGFLSLIG